VRATLPELPTAMHASDSLASKVDRACLDQVESWVLAQSVGQEFEATVLRSDNNGGEIFVAEPAVLARCAGTGLPEGGRIRVRVSTVDTAARKVGFERA
jgi:exoribonuclease R